MPAGDPRFAVIQANVLHRFPELVTELKGDAARLLRRLHIDPRVIGSREAGIEYGTFVQLLELAAADLDCPDFGMRLAMRQRGKAIGPIGVVMRHSQTVGQALDYCIEHIHAYCLAIQLRLRSDRTDQPLLLGLDTLIEASAEKAQAMEYALMLAHLNITDISGGAARARAILFDHEPMSSLRLYRSLFGCDVRFGQRSNGLVLSQQDLSCRTVDPDEQIYRMATLFIDHHFPSAMPPVHSRIRALIEKHLGTDGCTSEHVAAEIGLHPRTLQRRLRSEGASFEKIKDDVRCRVAVHHLERGDMSLTALAEKLGYAEASVLSRSCYRWFGISPLKIRRGDLAHNIGSTDGAGADAQHEAETKRRVMGNIT